MMFDHFMFSRRRRHTSSITVCGLGDVSNRQGLPEAAMAGALGIRLGGASFYSGQLNEKPFIGDNLRELELSDITQSQKIMFTASFLGLAGVIAIELLF